MKNTIRKILVATLSLASVGLCSWLSADEVSKARFGSLHRDDMVVVDVKPGIDTNAVQALIDEYDRLVIRPREDGIATGFYSLPVTSVNGHTGDVVLAVGDISGAVDTVTFDQVLNDVYDDLDTNLFLLASAINTNYTFLYTLGSNNYASAYLANERAWNLERWTSNATRRVMFTDDPASNLKSSAYFTHHNTQLVDTVTDVLHTKAVMRRDDVWSAVDLSGIRAAGVPVGQYSTAAGFLSGAAGDASFADGYRTVALNTGEHAHGIFNLSHQVPVFEEGTLYGVGDCVRVPPFAQLYQCTAEHTAVSWDADRDKWTSLGSFGASGNTLSSVGFGASDTARRNAIETMQDGKVYVYGVGGYDGTNPDTAVDVSSFAAGLVTSSVTNGLATTNQVLDVSRSFARTAEGLLQFISSVEAAAETEESVTRRITAATNGLVTSSVTNGLATTNYVIAATNGVFDILTDVTSERRWVLDSGDVHLEITDWYLPNGPEDGPFSFRLNGTLISGEMAGGMSQDTIALKTWDDGRYAVTGAWFIPAESPDRWGDIIVVEGDTGNQVASLGQFVLMTDTQNALGFTRLTDLTDPASKLRRELPFVTADDVYGIVTNEVSLGSVWELHGIPDNLGTDRYGVPNPVYTLFFDPTGAGIAVLQHDGEQDYSIMNSNIRDAGATFIQLYNATGIGGEYDITATRRDLGTRNALGLARLADVPTNNNQLVNGAGYVSASDVSNIVTNEVEVTPRAYKVTFTGGAAAVSPFYITDVVWTRSGEMLYCSYKVNGISVTNEGGVIDAERIALLISFRIGDFAFQADLSAPQTMPDQWDLFEETTDDYDRNVEIIQPTTRNALGLARLADLDDAIRGRGTNSVAIGNTLTTADTISAVAVGDGAVATNEHVVAVGPAAETGGAQATAVGFASKAASAQSLALGEYTEAKLARSAVSVGSKTVASARQESWDVTQSKYSDSAPVALGYRAVAIGNRALAVGSAVSVSDGSGDFPGSANWSATMAYGDGSIAIGKEAKALADGAVQIGQGVNSNAHTVSMLGHRLLDITGTLAAERLPSLVYDLELEARLAKVYKDEVTGKWCEVAVSNGVVVVRDTDVLGIYDIVWRKMIANRDVTAFAIELNETNFPGGPVYSVSAKVAVNTKAPRLIEWGDGTYDIVNSASWATISHTYPGYGFYLIQGTAVDFYATETSATSNRIAIVKAYKLSSTQDTASRMFINSSITTLDGFSWGGCVNADNCFYECRKLKGKVPTFEGTKVGSAKFVFGRTGLQELGSDFSWGSVTNAYFAFRDCGALKTIADNLDDATLMPPTITNPTNCVFGAAKELQSHFTPLWGGTKQE